MSRGMYLNLRYVSLSLHTQKEGKFLWVAISNTNMKCLTLTPSIR